ncbi:Chemotaxis response regulator protein-glutamate methylesterase CheB (EC 3.1.1.61) [Methylomonas albis]|uniref:Protein-glutamate methylesterase/protein-glutamine glutaminase n=1 Tax=Methylomonas albis TaxID=1854563 RepID=A0ABR9D5S0_9GAMM|nr:chemotaxis response regulator protein-glutamate methylesterase [Methylomonas albis]MBD9358467.1 chemotaxis response regulator protein-glutamate methylesterase [Methylomonas albis]CAD6881878.1 Chemotaxis response regulator protein-glutamate methylesterase CheB (EC 3.1.1.61) [Methylomonas albis]
MSDKKIGVLIVDDSAVVRQVLTQLLSKSADIKVLGSVSDPIFAMAKMNQDWPDVVVLDVEMPRMDGITFLKKIMSVRPTPVVICSTLTEKGAETTMQALSAGATGIVTKPKAGLKSFLEDDSGDIIHAIKAAAMTDMRCMKAMTMAVHAKPGRVQNEQATTVSANANANASASALAATTDRLVAIGTSTGGTQALEVVLTQLSRISPGIVIVQHMPEKFTGAFAARLNSICEIEVKEAVSGDRVIAGRALIAPGGKHMSVKRSGAQYVVDVQDGPLVNRHRPSVDVLFRSVAKWAGKNALGIIMTGMGDDGARGLKDMHAVGARTAGQDEKTCVVYGMPKEAMKLGAVQQELPLQAIAGLIEQYGK